MSYLNSMTRSAIKTSVNRFLKDSATITQDVITLDQYNGQVHTPQVVGVSVPCRIIMLDRSNVSRAGLVGEQESMRDMYRIVVKQGTNLAVDQQIQVNGLTYNVVNILSELTDEVFESAIVTRQR